MGPGLTVVLGEFASFVKIILVKFPNHACCCGICCMGMLVREPFELTCGREFVELTWFSPLREPVEPLCTMPVRDPVEGVWETYRNPPAPVIPCKDPELLEWTIPGIA